MNNCSTSASHHALLSRGFIRGMLYTRPACCISTGSSPYLFIYLLQARLHFNQKTNCSSVLMPGITSYLRKPLKF